jgi:hypothetical protein
MKTPSYRAPFRPADLAAEIAANRARAEEITEKAFEVLRLPEPDTFLGRQHYPLIPLPEDRSRDPSQGTE